MVYGNEQLDDREWFCTDIIYFGGELIKEEITEATRTLQPTEVEYDTSGLPAGFDNRYKGRHVAYAWWD